MDGSQFRLGAHNWDRCSARLKSHWQEAGSNPPKRKPSHPQLKPSRKLRISSESFRLGQRKYGLTRFLRMSFRLLRMSYLRRFGGELFTICNYWLLTIWVLHIQQPTFRHHLWVKQPSVTALT